MIPVGVAVAELAVIQDAEGQQFAGGETTGVVPGAQAHEVRAGSGEIEARGDIKLAVGQGGIQRTREGEAAPASDRPTAPPPYRPSEALHPGKRNGRNPNRIPPSPNPGTKKPSVSLLRRTVLKA